MAQRSTNRAIGGRRGGFPRGGKGQGRHRVVSFMRSDSLSPDQRRRAMRANRGRTGPERRVAAALWRAGFRYLSAEGYRSRVGRRFPGSPDLIFVGRRCVVFVDGCFWHGCNRCHNFRRDCNAWWLAKIVGNVRRDRRVRRGLRRNGWTVLVVREHAVRSQPGLERTIQRLISRIPPI
jgi:DNA mismatch endonuclease (patch repair protein)